MQSDEHKSATDRFDATREAILTEATALLGAGLSKPITLREVAERVGLKTTSITYYFPRRDALISACLDRTLDRVDAMLDAAASHPTPKTRIRALIANAFQRMSDRMTGQEPDLASLSHITALEKSDHDRMVARWRGIFHRVRDMIVQGPTERDRARAAAHAHVLLNLLFSLYLWAITFEPDQHPRLAERLSDIVVNGIAGPQARWIPLAVDPGALVTEQAGLPDFLRVATRMINERGYHAASITRIAGEINLTKGSFYHHLQTKEALVQACFDRTLATIAAAYSQSAAAGDDWQRLVTMIAALVEVQFSGQAALLHSSAIAAMPDESGRIMAGRAVASGRRLEGLISDCIAEGSARAVDAFVASQALMSLVNSAADFIGWARAMPRDEAVQIYCEAVVCGIIDRA